MFVGVVKETFPGETRVALVPSVVPTLKKAGIDVVIEAGAGLRAGYPDEAYTAAGVTLAKDRQEVTQRAETLVMVQGPTKQRDADLSAITQQHTLIALLDPLQNAEAVQKLAARGATSFALELIPRITRAQSMDVLSSMANLAGYKAVLLAATQSPRAFPMMMTAAGTITPARVLVLGAGVAGLQAIATAKRLGAVVEAYDVRPEVKEQVLSVGGKFVDLGLDTQNASDTGGYAKAQSAEFIAAQQEKLAQFVRHADIVITTAQVPGKRAPRLVTLAMQKGMKPGSVIVDLAADSGGNVETTKAGQNIVVDGVTIMGPENVAASLPFHASQLFSKNVTTFLLHLIKDGKLVIDTQDEITRETLVTQGGRVVHARLNTAAQRTA